MYARIGSLEHSRVAASLYVSSDFARCGEILARAWVAGFENGGFFLFVWRWKFFVYFVFTCRGIYREMEARDGF